MKKLYPREESRVNTSETSEQKKPQDFSDAPARPDVARPKRGFTKSPTAVLLAMAKDPACPLKLNDLPIVELTACYAHKLKSGGRGLAFPSKKTLADQLGTCRQTPGRALGRAVKSGLCIMYRVRMAKGQEDGGRWGTPYYDFAPYFQLCGENVQPRSKAQVQQYLDEKGYWRRGMTLERVGPEAPEGSPETEAHRGTNSYTGEGASPLREGGSTVEQKSSTNKTESGNCFVNKKQYKSGPKPGRGVESLGAAEFAVYCRLMEIRYTPFKAVYDLKKHGAAYVEARLDYVLRDTKGIKTKSNFLNSIMEQTMDKLYAGPGAKPKRPEPAPRPEAPRTAPARPEAPKPPAAPSTPLRGFPQGRPAPATPEPAKQMTLAEQCAVQLRKLEVYDARTIDLGRAHAKGDRDCSESLRVKLDLPLEGMNLATLTLLLDHCKTVRAKMGAANEEDHNEQTD